MTDKQLVDRLKKKDEEAFTYLIEKHQVKIRNTCRGMLHNSYEADDMAQEVFIEIYTSIHKFKGDSALFTWMYRIAVNKCLNHIRSKKRRKWMDILKGNEPNQDNTRSMTDHYEPQMLMEEKENARMLQMAIDSLPENQKVAFVLSKYDDLSNPEIAEIMKTTVSSVESLIFRAKKNLQKKLRTYFKDFNAY